ncbi:MAG: DinB family protein [Gemmatimonadota bacterium]
MNIFRGSKRRVHGHAALLTAVVLSACSAADAADDAAVPADESLPADASVALDAKAMLADVEAKISTANDKFMQLAEAVPEDQWDWRPMEGVRSFREVFIHIAADNWLASVTGSQVPDDIPATDDLSWIGPYQEQRLSKDETLDHLGRSFDFLLESLDATRDRLDESISLGGQEWTTARLWVELATHMHEHLGQTVAYARMNEIVPPWSR